MADKSVAIAVTTYRNPQGLRRLLDNINWAGRPAGVPLYVFEDPSPNGDRDFVSEYNRVVCSAYGVPFLTAPYWGCMQGIIDYALHTTKEDWIVYVPDDVWFPKRGLLAECENVLKYGRDFVGGIQAPYWNLSDLLQQGVIASREALLCATELPEIPRNPHWDNGGVPRIYINLNGAGFAISRRLYEAMGGWPTCTWRLDEWAGYQAWRHGMVCLTVPGPPRVHLLGGSTGKLPPGMPDYHSEEAWRRATGGLSPSDTATETYAIMARLPGETWPDIVRHFEGETSVAV